MNFIYINLLNLITTYPQLINSGITLANIGTWLVQTINNAISILAAAFMAVYALKINFKF